MNQTAPRSPMRAALPVAVIVAAGILAFLLGMLFMSKKDASPAPQAVTSRPQALISQTSAPTASPSAATAGTSTSTISSANRSTGANIQTTTARSAPSQTAQSPTAEPTAQFPPDASIRCSPNGESDNLSPIPVANVRNKIQTTTCGFDANLKAAVDAELKERPEASRFQVSPYSPYRHMPLSYSCVRENHLTTCVPTAHDSDVVVYIRDNVR